MSSTPAAIAAMFRLASPRACPAAPCARRMRLALLLALLAAPATVLAQAERYAIDPVHTRVMFELSHAGYSQAIGTVSGSTGTLVFDPADWNSARVEVSVPLARLDLGDDKWNRAALGRNLLDGEDHPVASFTSTRVEPVDATHASVFGTLTLRGVAREVKLDVAFNQVKRYPLPPFRRTIGFSATTTISRKDFGIREWPTVIGDSVALRIEAEAQLLRDGDAETTPDAPAPVPAPEDPATEDASSKAPTTPTQDPTP
jgi:polyisoprenoid-binding protein YceI